MAGAYQKYPEYKISGVKWLGEVPAHWKIVNAKRLFPERNTKAVKSDKQLTASQKHGVIYQEDFMTLEGQKVVQVVTGNDILKHVEPGDFVISMRSFQGGIEYCAFRGCVSSAYVPVVPTQKVCVSFFRYLLKCEPYIQGLQSTTNLVRDGQALRYGNFAQVLLPDIPFEEQENIAKFLDLEIPRIHSLIAKQRQLIKLLKEKCQAVVSHAVTKGLNPDAPMKDSGVESLGEIPKHWMVSRLKYFKAQTANSFVDGPFGSNLKSEHFIDGGDVYVIESNFATTGNLDAENLKTISNQHFEKIKRSSTEGGDIIIAKIGARYGYSSILPNLDKKAVVSGNSLKLSVNYDLVITEYAHNLLTHLKLHDAMDDGVNVTAQPALSLGGLNNLPFVAPPLEEQAQIVDYIKRMNEQYTRLISSAEKSIELSQERRTALISAAVTGKIDVRNWQPEETESSMEDCA